MLEALLSKEVLAAVLGALVILVGGFGLYVRNEKKRQRIAIFTRLAAIPDWIAAREEASQLLSAIPTVFSGYFDDRVRIAYRNYHGSLNPYLSVVWVREPGSQAPLRTLYVSLFSDQNIFRRDLIRELAIASGWMRRRRAADFDFSSLAISLVPQGQVPIPPPVVGTPAQPTGPAQPAASAPPLQQP